MERVKRFAGGGWSEGEGGDVSVAPTQTTKEPSSTVERNGHPQPSGARRNLQDRVTMLWVGSRRCVAVVVMTSTAASETSSSVGSSNLCLPLTIRSSSSYHPTSEVR